MSMSLRSSPGIAKTFTRVSPKVCFAFFCFFLFFLCCIVYLAAGSIFRKLTQFLAELFGLLGLHYKWEYFVNAYDGRSSENARESRHVFFVREFAGVVQVFHDKVNDLVAICEDINAAKDKLSDVPYEFQSFKEILDQIQAQVSRFDIFSFSLPVVCVFHLELAVIYTGASIHLSC
jgi:hypothetical protein